MKTGQSAAQSKISHYLSDCLYKIGHRRSGTEIRDQLKSLLIFHYATPITTIQAAQSVF